MTSVCRDQVFSVTLPLSVLCKEACQHVEMWDYRYAAVGTGSCRVAWLPARRDVGLSLYSCGNKVLLGLRAVTLCSCGNRELLELRVAGTESCGTSELWEHRAVELLGCGIWDSCVNCGNKELWEYRAVGT